jgi:hypothetical protein
MTALNAMRQRSMIARTMRKIHVPAKAPEEDGVQALEKSGVSWAFLKVIIVIEVDMLLEPELVLLPISIPSIMKKLKT